MALSSRNVVVGAANSTQNTVDAVLTDSYTVGSGTELLVVFVAAEESSSLAGAGGLGLVASMTYGGVAMTHAEGFGGGHLGFGDRLGEIWYLVNPTPGTADIVTTFDGTTDAIIAIAAEVIGGVDTGSPIGAVGTNEEQPSTGNCFVSVNTATAASLVMGICAVRRGATANSNPFTPITGTELADGATGTAANVEVSYWVAELLTTTTGTYTLDATMTADNQYAAVAVEIKPASAGAGVPVKMASYRRRRAA